MNGSLLQTIVTDSRTYLATAIGLAGVFFSSKRGPEHWQVAGWKISARWAALLLPTVILISGFFLEVLQFDWSGEFALGIMWAFGFVFSLNLFNFSGKLMRGAGLLFALFFSYCIYGILHGWLARAAHGTPFR